MQLRRLDIQKAVKNPNWQRFRTSLKRKTTKVKRKSLTLYLQTQNYSTQSKIQVQNYINALRRSGQL